MLTSPGFFFKEVNLCMMYLNPPRSLRGSRFALQSAKKGYTGKIVETIIRHVLCSLLLCDMLCDRKGLSHILKKNADIKFINRINESIFQIQCRL